MDMKKRPLIKALETYTKEETSRFHMPGHRNGKTVPSLAFLQEHLYDFDVTEIDGTDHLHYPEESIKASQILLAKAMGSKESCYCVNGSTAVNYAMIFGLLKPGDEVLLERSCHQSVFQALGLRGLKPRFIKPQLDPEWALPLPPALTDIQEAYEKYPMIKAVILTSPNYYGKVAPLKEISHFLKMHGLYLIVDEAHGAHFAFSDKLPPTAMAMGAHVSSVSFHKTLPVLTQGAVLNLSEDLQESERSRIRHYLRVFQTSSPSYTMLVSMENARALMEEEGEALYDQLLREARLLREQLARIPQVEVYGNEDAFTDAARLVIRTPLPGEFLMGELRKKHRIQAEMTLGSIIVFILSPFDRKEDLERLPEAIAAVRTENEELWACPVSPFILHYSEEMELLYDLEEILFLEQEEIPVENAFGRISAETITPYPPGIPLILPGERIGEKEVRLLVELFQGDGILKSASKSKMGITVLK
ncbi:aminotransferase class I/II-fold pyridoxal phosphate-dependent enzyme [Proteiniclasticum ruminis]|uniref:aminotransferase class I/II-fold pyridoxal phosphate-dependent enzyme n=1 Tax=Proteiniclasticum ruminis TaxID=398199 RepID=UPI00289FED42|nr:aminotransferase class I/II-fold pyridoxal phosphate-dependent enzyme [Proteiniclasticum ruminis]